MQFEASYLMGEALRSLERYREALKPLEVAAALRPAEIGVAIALGWCYKRTHRLAQAIDVLERAQRHNPDDDSGLLHYNLACYWSLAGNAAKALDELAAALDLEPELRNLIAEESDFDQLRGNPDFERLTVGPAPLA
jgi:tetratricopeptide (TPR) repeat protein